MKKPIVFSNRFEKDEIDLIKMILRVSSEKRPDVSSILQHTFFSSIEEDEELQIEKKKNKPLGHPDKSDSTISTLNQTSLELENLGKPKNKPASQNSQAIKNSEKEFKYFIPQGAKGMVNKGHGYLPASSNMTLPIQNYNHSSNFGESNGSSLPVNLNNSANSAYRGQHTGTNSKGTIQAGHSGRHLHGQNSQGPYLQSSSQGPWKNSWTQID